ncbi:4-hydroxy-tetrahydrodipicolinate synthase [soil metagenome]
MMPLFAGVGVALVTLFDDDGGLDAPATAALAGQLVELGVRAVLVAGSTGEALALSAEERVSLVRAVRDALPSGVPVLAGTGAATGVQAAVLTVAAFDAGADAALVLSPPRVVDPHSYYDTVADAAGDRPLLAYHYPLASAPGVPVALLPELPVTGIKDSSGEPERLLGTLEVFGGAVYTGSATLLSMAGAVGATGAILALANAEPQLCAAAFEGDGKAQRALLTAHRVASTDFPTGIKSLVADRFGCSRVARLGR